MKVSLTICCALTMFLSYGQVALAQQNDALRCLDVVKPVVRNEDGSLSPNPAFDACLRNPIVTKPIVRPASSATTATAVTPGVGHAVSGATPPPQSRQWSVAPSSLVETAIRAWLPSGWQLKWDTKEVPRSPGMQASGDFLDAVKALAATRLQWSGADGSRLQILVFKADRIVQVRDITTNIEKSQATLPAIRTESLSGATP